VTANPSLAKDSQSEKPAASSALYCAPCKKKFSNDATWKTHLKSAKHIQNEKAAKNLSMQAGAGQRSSEYDDGERTNVQAFVLDN
jgi:hypothetical protein